MNLTPGNRHFIEACNGMPLMLRYTIYLNSMINVTKNAFKMVSEMLRNRIERRSKLIQKRYKNPAVKKWLRKKKKKPKKTHLQLKNYFLAKRV